MKGRAAVKQVVTWSKKPSVEHVLLGQLAQAKEIGPFQVFDEAMIGRQPAGRTLETVAGQVEPAAERLVVAGAPPAIGPVDDGLPNLAERIGVGPPRADRQETLVRGDVNVKPGRVNVAGRLMAELDAGVGLVRFSAAREPRVAIDPQQRAAHAPVGGHKIPGDLLQSRLEGANEGQARLQDLGLIARLCSPETTAGCCCRRVLRETRRSSAGNGGIRNAAVLYSRSSLCVAAPSDKTAHSPFKILLEADTSLAPLWRCYPPLDGLSAGAGDGAVSAAVGCMGGVSILNLGNLFFHSSIVWSKNPSSGPAPLIVANSRPL